jgi:hypothetical protein
MIAKTLSMKQLLGNATVPIPWASVTPQAPPQSHTLLCASICVCCCCPFLIFPTLLYSCPGPYLDSFWGVQTLFNKAGDNYDNQCTCLGVFVDLACSLLTFSACQPSAYLNTNDERRLLFSNIVEATVSVGFAT